MRLEMEITKASELQQTLEPWGVSVRLFQNESRRVKIGLFSVDPGRSMNMHAHEDTDELIYVLEGQANFTVDEREIELSEGSTIVVPRRILHKAFNKGAKPYWCLYVVSALK